ncbi:MAG: hypothetical protein WC758_08465 [Candidatus Woesearchaeota archaeon]|jgi:hypothetical protein
MITTIGEKYLLKFKINGQEFIYTAKLKQDNDSYLTLDIVSAPGNNNLLLISKVN